MDINKTKKALSVLKALVYTENNGKPKMLNLSAGGSGEMKSVLQFMPETWREYSKQITGKDNTPMTPENEMAVGLHKVNEWLENGYTPEQIFSMWNSGRPNAYKQGVKGVNSKGVKYDTPAYVKKATNFLSQFEKEDTKKPIQEDTMNRPNKYTGLITPQQNKPQSQPGVLPS